MVQVTPPDLTAPNRLYHPQDNPDNVIPGQNFKLEKPKITPNLHNQNPHFHQYLTRNPDNTLNTSSKPLTFLKPAKNHYPNEFQLKKPHQNSQLTHQGTNENLYQPHQNSYNRFPHQPHKDTYQNPHKPPQNTYHQFPPHQNPHQPSKNTYQPPHHQILLPKPHQDKMVYYPMDYDDYDIHKPSKHPPKSDYHHHHESECCEIVVDTFTLVSLVAFIGAATFFLNTVITMNIVMTRKKRSLVNDVENFHDIFSDALNNGRSILIFIPNYWIWSLIVD